MRVFVTGGTGFLGKRVVRRLLADGHDVCCLVRPGSEGCATARLLPDFGDRIRVVEGSLERLSAALDEVGQIDVVIHIAAAMGGGPAVLFLNNVVATRRLIEAVPRLGAKRFVLISSMGVYGTWDLRKGATLDETCPLESKGHLRDPYSYSKIAQEKAAWAAQQDGLPLVVVRPGVIYGPGKGFLSARVGLQFGSVMIRMGGAQRVPYTHVENCAEAVVLAATAPNVEGQAFNIIDDNLPRARSLLKLYRQKVERLHVLPIPRAAIQPMSRLCQWYNRWSKGQLPAILTPYKSAAQWKPLKYSNAKAKSMLGWTPRVGFEDGLRGTCTWAQDQRNAVAKAKGADVTSAGSSKAAFSHNAVRPAV